MNNELELVLFDEMNGAPQIQITRHERDRRLTRDVDLTYLDKITLDQIEALVETRHTAGGITESITISLGQHIQLAAEATQMMGHRVQTIQELDTPNGKVQIRIKRLELAA